jgi:hypothetical protein
MDANGPNASSSHLLPEPKHANTRASEAGDVAAEPGGGSLDHVARPREENVEDPALALRDDRLPPGQPGARPRDYVDRLDRNLPSLCNRGAA